MKRTSTTITGREIDYLNPQPDQFDIHDIAVGISKECRFNGQCAGHYSVAQHSVLVSRLVPHEYALEALLHDASEAFCRDISSPLKALLPDYRRIEERIQNAIYARFGVFPTPESHAVVKQADLLMLMTERRDLLNREDSDEAWKSYLHIKPVEHMRIRPMERDEAYTLFMDRYDELTAYRQQEYLPQLQHTSHRTRPVM